TLRKPHRGFVRREARRPSCDAGRSARMKLLDLSELAARNLREAILRNSLTTLGVAVGVASLVAMLSLGVGLQTLASDRLTKSGLFDAIFVTSRREFRGPGSGAPPKSPVGAPKENPKPLDEDGRQHFAS